MANRVILATLGTLLVGGGVLAYALSGSDGSLDSAGQDLYARYQSMQTDPPDAADLRAFLKDVEKHPAMERDPGLRRARAWALTVAQAFRPRNSRQTSHSAPPMPKVA